MREASSLEVLIKREKRKYVKKSGFQFLKELIELIYVPSLKSFIICFLFFIIFSIPSHCRKLDLFNSIVSFQASNHYQNFIAINAGIGVIILSLFIFIAESMRDDKTTYKARVLLKESFLFPIAIVHILTFFNFVWGDINIFSLLPISIIGLLTIFSLLKLTSILLNRSEFFEKRNQLLKDRLKRSINLAFDERLGNGILLGELGEDKILLDYNPFINVRDKRFHFFHSNKYGVVKSIDLNALNKFAEEVEKESNKNGYSFYVDKEPVLEVDKERSISETKGKKYKNKYHYLLKKYKDKISEENKALLCVDKEAIKDIEVIKELNEILKNIFTIKRVDNNISEQMRLELSGIKDQFINAISNRSLGEIENFSEIYVNLAEAFLELLKVYGGGYTIEQARKEQTAIFGGWGEIRWIKKDVREIFKKAIESCDEDIIENISFLPIKIAIKAIKYRDHYLFQEFIWFSVLLYSYVTQENNKDLKKFMIDRSWRYLKEIADFYIEPELVKVDISEEELNNLKNFVIYLLIVFQSLLKNSYEKRDLKSFEKFLDVVKKLFRNFKPSKSQQNSQILKVQLKNEYLTDNERNKLKEILKRQEVLENIEKEINQKRQQMFFGLASWILSEFTKDKNIQDFYKKIKVFTPSKLEDLTEIFLQSHSFTVERFWGWVGWETDKLPEDEAHWIDVKGKLERFYCVKSLQILESKLEEEIDIIKVPDSRDLALMAGDNGKLINILNEISNNPKNWEFVLSDKAIKQIPLFKKLLSEAKNLQKQKEVEQKRIKKISRKKVNEFKNDLIDGFYKSVVLRDIFNYYNLYIDKSKEEYRGNLLRLGINQVDDKAAFFDDWYVHYKNWGSNYGSNLALGEELHLLGVISSNCKIIKKYEFDATIKKFRYLSNIFILASNVNLFLFFKDSNNFIPKWHKDSPQLKEKDIKAFEGSYLFEGKYIPIFRNYLGVVDKQILILNKSKLGKLIQYSPLNEGESKDLKKDIFYMNIQSFSENPKLMDDITKKPPAWLIKKGSEDEWKEYLCERALIQIYERFEYIKHDDFEGYLLELMD